MIDGMFSALSGLNTSARKLQVSSNNIANLSTNGFKAGRAEIADVKNGGSQVSSTSRVTSQGAFQFTNNPLDLAISGSGYFQVALGDGGTGYTRSGSLQQDAGGRLVTADGKPLVPEINVPGNSTGVSIDAGGRVTAQVEGKPQVIGQIQLANFNNSGGLASQGDNLFTQSAASGDPVAGAPATGGFGALVSGMLEMSNVDIAAEVVDQILAKTAFKANASVIRTSDEMVGTLLDIKT